MTELSLYSFIEGVVNVINPVQNRFYVLEGYGNDLNADNNDEVLIGNMINQVNWVKKYPCAVLMPPVEISRNKSKNTTRFRLKLYFLTTTHNSGNSITKSVNPQTNTSKKSIKEDWSEMRSAAEDFMGTMLSKFYSDITVLEFIRPVKTSPESYDRVSNMGNDKLSGIALSFELDVVQACLGSGNVPSFTPPSTCGVCDPTRGSANQVWTISADGTSVGWQDSQGGNGGGGGMLRVVIEIAADTPALSAASTDYVYFITGPTTLVLPTAVGNRNRYTVIRKGTDTANVVTVLGQTIAGLIGGPASTVSIIRQYSAIDLLSDGANWYVA